MPLSIDDFEALESTGEGTNAERVMRFLGSNPDTAFKAAEITEKAGVDENSIHPVLGRLADEGLLEHRRPYWALADDDIDGPEAARARLAAARGAAGAARTESSGHPPRCRWRSG